MSYNPNKNIDTDVCRGLENLFTALKRKGIVLKGLELSKPLKLFGTDMKSVALDFGVGYNRRHVKIKTPKSGVEG